MAFAAEAPDVNDECHRSATGPMSARENFRLKPERLESTQVARKARAVATEIPGDPYSTPVNGKSNHINEFSLRTLGRNATVREVGTFPLLQPKAQIGDLRALPYTCRHRAQEGRRTRLETRARGTGFVTVYIVKRSCITTKIKTRIVPKAATAEDTITEDST
ncbi:hypothetical protein NDU88_000361 [Pleurodeles waltl]|uniref:Uncharacterized protein n=1 Tax=Pleurodeles waltl TaxID=8319 RepID=A0AAV7S6K7_PLEWA|nr:hypothetical protein NDU88_000361 [Pleurodeles waltl]